MSDEIKDSDSITELDEIVSGAVISFTSFGFQRALLVLLAYVISTFVSPGMYGYISVFTRFQGFATRLAAGFNTAISRTLPRNEKETQNAIITALLPVLVLAWIVIGGAIYLSRGLIIEYTLLLPKHESAISMFAMAVLPFILLVAVSAIFKAYKSMRVAHILWTIGRPLSFILSAIILIAAGLFSLVNFWFGLIAIISFFTFIGIIVLYSLEEFQITSPFVATETIIDFLRYGSYASTSSIFVLLQSYSIVLFIAVYLSPVTAGVVGLALVLGDITRWPLKSINQIFPQIATKVYAEDDMELLDHLYEITSLIITFFSIPVFALYFLFDTTIIGVFATEYVPYSETVIIIALGQLIASVFGSVGLLLMMTDNERPSLLIQVLMSIIAIPIYFYMTVNFGAVGLSIAFLIALTINNIFELATLYHFEQLFPFTKQHVFLAIFSIGAFGTLHIIFELLLSSLLLRVTLFIFFIGLYFSGSVKYILRDDDREFLQLIKKQIY